LDVTACAHRYFEQSLISCSDREEAKPNIIVVGADGGQLQTLNRIDTAVGIVPATIARCPRELDTA